MGKAASVILKCLKEKGIAQRQLASIMGEDVRNLNQQLHRQQDMKVERFIDVLEHAGYRLEIVDNDGIRKVSKKFAKEVIETRKPKGLFWYEEDEAIVGIDNSNNDAWVEEFKFSSKEDCFKWLRGDFYNNVQGIYDNVKKN